MIVIVLNKLYSLMNCPYLVDHNRTLGCYSQNTIERYLSEQTPRPPKPTKGIYLERKLSGKDEFL